MIRNNDYIHAVNRSQFVRACFDEAIVDRRLHGKWWNLDDVAKFMNEKYTLSDETNIKHEELLRCFNRFYTDTTTTGNRVIIDSKTVLLLFRHVFRHGKGPRRHFIYATFEEESCVPPSFSLAKGASKWEEECASNPLPRVTRQVMSAAPIEPPTK